jgi:hypothetical protein
VAVREGASPVGGVAPNRMDDQTQSGSHRTLSRPECPDVVFSFHDQDEIGPKMLARIAKRTGLEPKDLSRSGRERADSIGNKSIPAYKFLQ